MQFVTSWDPAAIRTAAGEALAGVLPRPTRRLHDAIHGNLGADNDLPHASLSLDCLKDDLATAFPTIVEVEIDAAFTALLERQSGALIVGSDPLFRGRSRFGSDDRHKTSATSAV